LVLAVLALGVRPRSALAWTASGVLAPNQGSSALGSGGVTATSGANASLQISLAGANPNATYAVFSCLPLTTGDFDCVGLNNPPGFQSVKLMPKALAPIVVTLVQQGTVRTDDNGNTTATIPLTSVLLPDTPRSQYNVVELINTGDATDAYTALNLLRPIQPVAGVVSINPTTVTTAIGVPVYVLAQFPGYVYPVAITTLNGVQFVPQIVVPTNVFFGSPFTFTQGLCPGGLPPHAVPGPGGVIFFTC
jgi:hypothetical protein